MKKIGKKFLQFLMLFSMIFSNLQTPIQVFADELGTQEPIKGDIKIGENGTISTENSVSTTSTSTDGKVQVKKTLTKTDTEGKYTVDFEITGTESTVPVYVVLVFDTSGSMCNSYYGYCRDNEKWDNAVSAGQSFAKTIIDTIPTSKVALVTFDNEANKARGFSRDELPTSVFGSPGGGTNLHDGLVKAQDYLTNSIPEADKATAQKYVVVLSDGKPTYYNYGGNGEDTTKNVLDATLGTSQTIKNGGTEIFAIGYELPTDTVYPYQYTYNGTTYSNLTAEQILRLVATPDTSSDVTHYQSASSKDVIVQTFAEIARKISLPGKNATLTDNIGSNFKVVQENDTTPGGTYTSAFGGSYVSNQITEITKDKITISFDIEIDPDATEGWHNTNAGFKLEYTDGSGNSQTINSTEDPYVYWVPNQYDYVVNYYKDTFESDPIASDTRQATKGTIIDATNADVNKYLTEAGSEYEYNTIDPESITITNNGTHEELNILYTLKKYNYSVNYYYDNVLDLETSNRITATISEVEHGTEVDPTTYYLENIQGETVKDGYKLDSKTSEEIVVIDSENEVINIYYTKDSFNYSVNYHFNGNKNDDLSTNSNLALYNDVIKSEDKHLSQDALDSNNYSDYFLDPEQEESNYKDITITSDPSKNVINIFYINTFVTNESITKDTTNIKNSENENTDKITNVSDIVSYEINYTSKVNNLQKDKVVTVTLTDTLPFEIDLAKSSYIIDDEEVNFNETTDNTNKCTVSGTTLTCVISRTNSAYTKEYNVDETVKLNLVYKDFVESITLTNNTLTNTVKGTTTVANKTTTGATDDATVEVAIPGSVTAIYVDESDNVLADPVGPTTGLIGQNYTTEAKTIYGYTLKAQPENKTGTYTYEAITVKYVYTKNAGELTTEENSKVQNNEIKGIDSEFSYTLTYSGTIDEFVGTATISITDKFQFEVETIEYDEKSCTFENNTLTCTKEVEITENQKTVNASFDVTVTYKDLSSEEDLTIANKATTEVKFDKTTETIETNETEDKISSSKVTAIYVDKDTKEEIATSVSTTGLIGEDYTTEAKTIYGYTLDKNPDNATGTYTADEITVTYEYTKNKGEVSNEKVNKSQETIISSIDSIFKYTITYSATIDEYVGEATITLTDTLPFEFESITYNEKSCTIDGKTLTCTKTETITESDKEISASFEIVVKYKDLSSKEDLTIKNEVNSLLTYGNESTTGKADVTDTISSSKVTAIYIDKDTKEEIATSVSTTGLIGEDYTTEAKTIYGYSLDKNPDNATGTYTADEITVTYEYTKNAGELTTEENSKVQNNEIKGIDSEFSYTLTYSGTIDEFVGTATISITDKFPFEVETIEYDEKSCTFENNTLTCTKEVEITENQKTVNVSFDVTVTYKDLSSEEDLIIANKATTEVKFDKTTETIETNETEDKVSSSKVTAIYIDKDTKKEIATSVSITGLIGQNYTTEAKTIYGYSLDKNPDNATGTYTADEITVTYEYTKNVGTSEEELDKIGPEKVDSIEGSFNYTIKYNTQVFNYIGDVSIKIVDTPSYEIDLEKTILPSSCKYENGLIVCEYAKTITNESESKISIIENFVLYYKNITSSEVTNKAEASTTYGEIDTYADDEVVTEISSGKLIVNYVTEDGKTLAPSEITESPVGTTYQTEKKTFDNYYLKEVVGQEEGKYQLEDTEVTYVYSLIPLPPQTGLESNVNTEYISLFLSIIGLFILRRKLRNSNV